MQQQQPFLNPFRTDQALAGALGGFNIAQLQDQQFERSMTSTFEGVRTPVLQGHTPSFGTVSQPNFGGNSIGAARNPDQLAQVIAQTVMSQFQKGMIRCVEDFFLPYDLFQQRQYDAWELPIVFQDSLTLVESQELVRAAGGSISFQVIYNQIRQRAPNVPMNQSMVPPQSMFMTKPRTSPHIQRVLQVFQQARQRGQTFQDTFQSVFQKSYIDQMDFQRFLMSSCGLQVSPVDVDKAFSFFKISAETMVSRIAFVQGLKALEANGGVAATDNISIAQKPQANSLSPQVAEAVRKALEANKITDLRNSRLTGMMVKYLAPPSNKAVVQLNQFVNFLRQLLGLDQTQAFQMASMFLLEVPGGMTNQQADYLIDFDSFQQQVSQSMASLGQPQFMQTWEQSRPSYETINKCAELIRRHVMVNGGNLMSFFEKVDTDHDNLLCGQELKIAFSQLGVALSDIESQALVKMFDKNGDGRVSYSELCMYFADVTSAMAIKDQTHWAYYIFETLRRHCHGNQQSLFALFGLNSQMFKGWEGERARIPREQFMRTLYQLQLPLSPEYEKRLFNLLDSGSGFQSQQDVDFMFFSELVGVHFQPVEFISKSFQLQPAQSTPIGQASRKFFRSLTKAMQRTGSSVDQLEAMLRSAELGLSFGGNSQGVIGYSEFQSRLQNFTGNTMDMQLMQQVAQRFQGTQPNTIKYQDFISSARFETEKVKIIELVFSSLCAALAQFGALSLRELFQKVSPNFLYAPQLDKATLDMILRASGGSPLQQFELDIIIAEYQSDAQHLSFEAFELEFKEYQVAGQNQQVPLVNTEFKRYINTNGGARKLGAGVVGPSMLSPQLRGILQRVGNILDMDPSLSMKHLVSQYQVSLHTGQISGNNFRSMMAISFKLREEEVRQLIDQYDPSGRGEVRMNDMLEDLKDLISDVRQRLDVINMLTTLGKSQITTGGQPVELQILANFGKDLEELYRAVLARGATDTSQLMQRYAQSSPGRNTLNQSEFTSAIYSLSLSREWKNHEIEQIFRYLDKAGTGQVDIRALDALLFKVTSKRPLGDLYEEVLERVARLFNGDDGFLSREMTKRASMQSPSQVETQIFCSVIRDYQPNQSGQLSLNDVMFLAKKYASPNNPQLLTIGSFVSDFRQIVQKRGLMVGMFNPQMGSGGATGGAIENGFVVQNNWNGYVPTNPGQGSRNTRTEQLEGSLDYERRSFSVGVSSSYFEQLVMSTYVAGQTVHAYFQPYIYQRGDPSEAITSDYFIQGVLALKVGWTNASAQEFFTQVDKWAHKGALTGKVSAMELDRAACLGCKRTIPEMHDEVLRQIVQESQKRYLDFKSLVTQADIGRSQVISIESLVQIVLNTMKVPALLQPDVVFLAKKYLVDLPTHIQYVKLLEDFERMAGSTGLVSGVNFQKICTYIRKACIAYHNSYEPSQYFKTKCVQLPRDCLLTPGDFHKACSDLQLIPDIIGNEAVANAVYAEIDTANTKKITMSQLDTYVKRVSMRADIKGMQDEVLGDLAQKVKQKGIKIENLFRSEDPTDRARVPESSFLIILRSTLQMKEVDAKVISLRYVDLTTVKNVSPEVNYKQFISQVQEKLREVGNIGLLDPNAAGNPNAMFKAGMHGFDSNSEIARRLNTILTTINQYLTKSRISLANILAKQETSGGLVLYDSFLTALRQLYITGVTEEDIRFAAENYLVVATSATPQGTPRSIDYRKFLADLKLHTNDPAKSMQSLTLEQQKFFSEFSQNIQKKQLTNKITNAFIDLDPTLKGYLSEQQITQILRTNGYSSLGEKQFAILFSALDTNSQREFNYKQLFELLFGAEQAQQVFVGATMGGPRPGTAQQFLMPLSVQGARSPILGEIGRKLIASGRNYEEDFKVRTNGVGERCAESDIWGVLGACGVKLTSDENNTFSSLLASLRDPYDQYPVMEILSSIGLPPQTLGIRGQKAAPKRILTDPERKRCQSLIIGLRRELDLMKKKPEEIFEKCRGGNKAQATIPEMNFRLALTQTPEFGESGRMMSDDDVRLLVYYLAQEVPGEVSFRKLYLAFTQTERDPPLAQEGSEEIQKYNQMLKDKMRTTTPLEVIELVTYMKQNQLSTSQVFKNAPSNGLIPVAEFQSALQAAGFQSRNLPKLVEAIDTQGKRISVNLMKLNEYITKNVSASGQKPSNMSAQAAREKYTKFDPKVRQILQQISEYLKRMNITLNQLFEKLDADRNGLLSRDEFVMSMPQVIMIPGVNMRDFAQIFEELDLNKDGSLSLSEFGMFIEGAKLDKQQRMNQIDPQIIQEMQNDAMSLFMQFDQNRDGNLNADELQYAMKSLKRDITLEEAKLMIAQVDQNGDGLINQKEFCDFLLSKMKEELLSIDDNVEELRARFMDGDVDHSGVLSVDEIYGVLLGMGADLKMEELIELMNEIDVDRNGTVDIDEFVALLTHCGNEVALQSEGSRKTLTGIKKLRKMNPMDFLKHFKSMPTSFVPSFFGQRWNQRKNLPSSAFMPIIDPKTMLYRDLMPVLQENIPANVMAQKEFHPKVRPFPTEVGCEFVFNEATGVPLPAGANFDRSNIVKRSIRVGIFDAIKKDYCYNAVQCPALYSGEVAEDIWNFQAPRENGLNPILFRCANRDDIKKPNMFMIFELVINVRIPGDKVVEMSCGWSQMDLDNADQFGRAMTHKLQIKGGTPTAEIIIKDSDVHKNRTGIKYSLMNLVSSKIDSQLTVQIRPLSKLADDARFHMDMLPSVCLLPERLLYFVSGFRNFLGDKLVMKQVGGIVSFKKPEGDPVITTFKRIFDAPDILETFVPIWVEDVINQLTTRQKMNVEHIIFKTKEALRKLYPVTYADTYSFSEATSTSSAAGDVQLSRQREELVKSALRYGHAQAKIKFDRPIEALSSFKPFTVRELEFEVWESHTEVQVDNILQQYGEYGLLAQAPLAPPPMLPNNRPFGQQPALGGATSQMASSSTGFNRFSLADQMNMRMR